MKKLVYFVLILTFFVFCGPKQQKVERTSEDGVEVVINHIEPYRIKDEPISFELQEKFAIDFEDEELAKIGIGAVRGFDVDSDGNVYCVSRNQIFKFNQDGQFMHKFGKRGQGPGEIQTIGSGRITDSDGMLIYDNGNNKFMFFDKNASLIKEVKNTSKISLFGGGAHSLDGNYYMFEELDFDPNEDRMGYHLTITNQEFKKIKELNEHVFKENLLKSNRYNLYDFYLKFRIFQGKIYASNQSKENLEINIYDFRGERIKGIKKESVKVRIPEEYKQKVLSAFKDTPLGRKIKENGYFPENFPPFNEFHIDDAGRIYVETFEGGATSNEIMVDIINPKGVFIGRKSLEKAQRRRFRHNRLYGIFEKESGYQVLLVYKMRWE